MTKDQKDTLCGCGLFVVVAVAMFAFGYIVRAAAYPYTPPRPAMYVPRPTEPELIDDLLDEQGLPYERLKRRPTLVYDGPVQVGDVVWPTSAVWGGIRFGYEKRQYAELVVIADNGDGTVQVFGRPPWRRFTTGGRWIDDADKERRDTVTMRAAELETVIRPSEE